MKKPPVEQTITLSVLGKNVTIREFDHPNVFEWARTAPELVIKSIESICAQEGWDNPQDAVTIIESYV